MGRQAGVQAWHECASIADVRQRFRAAHDAHTERRVLAVEAARTMQEVGGRRKGKSKAKPKAVRQLSGTFGPAPMEGDVAVVQDILGGREFCVVTGMDPTYSKRQIESMIVSARCCGLWSGVPACPCVCVRGCVRRRGLDLRGVDAVWRHGHSESSGTSSLNRQCNACV